MLITGSGLQVRVKLPQDFPTSLPEVFANREELGRQLAHIEKSGKICIAPSTGFLLDTTNPVGIVTEALERAAKVLNEGLTGRSEPDLQTEFLAYWNAGAEGLLSICDVNGGPRRLALVGLTLGEGMIPSRRASLVADTVDQAERWIGKLHGRIVAKASAYFVPFVSGFRPPDFEEQISTAQARALIRDHASSEARDAFEAWLKTTSLPATVIFSLPLQQGDGKTLAGLRFEPLEPDQPKRKLETDLGLAKHRHP